MKRRERREEDIERKTMREEEKERVREGIVKPHFFFFF
jgi:hypothetical protein